MSKSVLKVGGCSLNIAKWVLEMNLSKDEIQAVEKYTINGQQIKDLGEAENVLSIYGEKCKYAIHKSIREDALSNYHNLQ